jgi:ParB family chromosome partitioning protein
MVATGMAVLGEAPLCVRTEKAHNLKERSLEVIRIYRGLVAEDATRPESQFAFYLDEATLVTLGICYERVPRFGGGAYHPILRRLELRMFFLI